MSEWQPGRPWRVEQAEAAARAARFDFSCLPETGRLLSWAAASKPGGRLAESGTGYGVGTAWLAAGMTGDAVLVSVDHDETRSASARNLFADDPRVAILTGDWTLLRPSAPFDVFFCDGGGKRDDPAAVIEMLAPGGILILDDFTPHEGEWPPLYQGRPDHLRIRYLLDEQLVATEVRVRADASVVLATHR
jgi:predicted O-methyltransferase YrrM